MRFARAGRAIRSPGESPGWEGVSDGPEEGGIIHRLAQVGMRPVDERLMTGLRRVVPGQDDNGQVPARLPDEALHRRAVEFREMVVENHAVRSPPSTRLQETPSRLMGGGLEAGGTEQAEQRLPDRLLVVHHRDQGLDPVDHLVFLARPAGGDDWTLVQQPPAGGEVRGAVFAPGEQATAFPVAGAERATGRPAGPRSAPAGWLARVP